MMQYIYVLVLLFIIELLYFKIADRFNIIDKPNERSSHTRITLRGGGIIFYFSVLLYFCFSDFQYPYFFIGLSLITIISFLDDIMTLSNKVRLVVQLLSMILMFYQADIFSLHWIVIPIALIVAVGTINAYNFMDGINGITVTYSIAVLILLQIANYFYAYVDTRLIIYTIISCLVFGYFNFRLRAKCFAGDVGSVAIAFIILFLIAKLIVKTNNVIFILFLLVYGLDSIWTIVRRIIRKENIFEAHRSHLYQFFANENRSHPLVISLCYGLVQLISGILIIYASMQSRAYQWLIAFGLMAVGTIIYMLLKHNLIKKLKID